MNLPIADAKERLEALNIQHSFCVQAPAGSGKTELLTQRMLKLLAHCEQPEEILAFTFTRKASAEMRKRLLQSLNKAKTLSQAEIEELVTHEKLTFDLASSVLKQNQLKNWHLLENTQRLRINTIDSFNAYLTSLLPISSSFGSQTEITTDMEPIFQAAIQETLSYLDGESVLAEHIATLLQHLDNNLQSVQKLLTQLLYKRDQWLNHILTIRDNPELFAEELNNNLSELVEEKLAQTELLLSPYGHDIARLIKFAEANLASKEDYSLHLHHFDDALPGTDASQRDKWLALAQFFLTTKGELRKIVNIKNGFPKESDGKDPVEKSKFKEHKALFMDLRTRLLEKSEIELSLYELTLLPTANYQDQQWHILSALTAILPTLVAHLTLSLKQHSKVDYVQISSAALEALGAEDKPTDLSLRLDYQIKHILVDEFQDTSSLQATLLEKLTWGWGQDDGRTLFIVGDGMQSCYGFRNANVGLFLAARDNGIGAVKLNSLQLKVNFRSEAPVVTWVNQIFSQAFPLHDDISRGAVAYSPSEALHSNSANTGVETVLWLKDAEDSSLDTQQIQAIEARQIVQQYQRLSHTNPASSFAILVRGRSHLKAIVPALRAASISWNAKDIDTLSSYNEVTDLLTLLKALSNLADKTALLALLRTPYIGLALKDIHLIAHQANLTNLALWESLGTYEAIENLSDDALARLQRVIPVLREARNKRLTLPLRDWLEGTWIGLGGPATVTVNNDLSYINTFFQTLEQEALKNDIVDIHRFEEKLNSLYVTGLQQGSPNLHIMTIHNAKGLEFDYVFVPSLHRRAPANDKALLLWKEHLNKFGESKLLLGLLSKKGQEDDSTYRYLRVEDARRTKMENTRLLYIAITRAAKKAFLSGVITQKKDTLSPPVANSLLANIWPQLDPQQDSDLENPVDFRALSIENVQSDIIASEQATKPQIITTRLRADWKNPIALLQDQDDLVTSIEPIEKSHLNLVEKKIGDIIHDSLRLKVEKNVDFTQNTTLVKLSQHWHIKLKPVCSSQNELDEAIKTIKANLQSCLAHPKASWIFDSSHTDSACELALSDYRSSYRKEFIIDRTFVDADGTRWIIDYKSSRLGDEQSVDEFAKQQAEQYQQQVQNYAQLFQTIEERPAKTALFFTAIPHWLETSI